MLAVGVCSYICSFKVHTYACSRCVLDMPGYVYMHHICVCLPLKMTPAFLALCSVIMPIIGRATSAGYRARFEPVLPGAARAAAWSSSSL